MKIRSGFVSNSSSSSFMVSLRKLSIEQLCKIINHQMWGAKMGIEYANQPWSIEVRNGVLYGDTSMDNFDMQTFMDKLGVIGVVWEQDNHGADFSDETVESCDELCDNCQLRFACYTNRWNKKGDINDEEV